MPAFHLVKWRRKIMKHFNTDPKFEDVYRLYEFWPLVGIAMLLADGIARLLRKRDATAPDRLSREQAT